MGINTGIRHQIARDYFHGVRNAFKDLVDKGIIPEILLPIFLELRELRNESAHSYSIQISPEAAKIYAEKALAMTDLIKKS